MTNEKLDDLDYEILRHLSKNARISFRELARRTTSSVGTVVSRFENMRRNSIIKGTHLLLDHESLGYDLTAVISIRVSKGKLYEVEQELSSFSNICAVYDVTGDIDAIAIAKFRSRNELNDFIKKVQKIESVERTNTHIVLNTVREDFRISI